MDGIEMEAHMRTPWQVSLGILILAVSLLPIWLLDLTNAPIESRTRFWTTLVVAVALWGIARKIRVFRWLLLLLLGTGIVVSVWSFVAASTIEVQSALISLVQVVGLGLLFTPDANAWMGRPTADAQGTSR
jgi:hypothetical protein